MSSYDPRSLLDRLVGACVAVLVGALAIYAAVQLLEAVWVGLVVIGLLVVVISAGIAYWRQRSGGW